MPKGRWFDLRRFPVWYKENADKEKYPIEFFDDLASQSDRTAIEMIFSNIIKVSDIRSLILKYIESEKKEGLVIDTTERKGIKFRYKHYSVFVNISNEKSLWPKKVIITCEKLSK